MPKALTLKDVLYALEFEHKELVRWPSHKVGTAAVWSLEPGGAKVTARAADDARGTNLLTIVGGAKYGETRYRWKAAA